MRSGFLALFVSLSAFVALGSAQSDARPVTGKWGGIRGPGAGPAPFLSARPRHYRHGPGIVAVEPSRGRYLAEDAWFLSESSSYLADEGYPQGYYALPYGYSDEPPPWR